MTSALYPDYRNGKLDEQVERFLLELSASPSTPLRLLTPEEVRRSCSVMDWVRPRERAEAVEDLTIPAPGGELPIRIYLPYGNGPFPVLLYFHGGGWVFGSLDEADHLCHAFAHGVPAVVVSVAYRLAPEHTYPAALQDAEAALAWTRREIARLKGDPDVIGVAGESAGANLATVLALSARDRGEPPIAFELLLCPVVDLLHRDRESFRLFGSGPWLGSENIDYYYGQYLGASGLPAEPYVSPLLATELQGMPPTHILTAEFDVLRDEGQAYATRLEEAGVPVTHRRYDGMIHSFFVLNGVFEKANEAIDDCIAALRAHLK